MNDNVKKILNENMWDVATMGSEPNVAPVAFKAVLSDKMLAVADVFLTTTVDNILANGMVAISAYDQKTLEGYRVHGRAEYVTEGEVFDKLSHTVTEFSKGKMRVKGALIVKVEKIISTAPGASKEAL